MFCDKGVKYYTKTASGTQKTTKVHFCLYLMYVTTMCFRRRNLSSECLVKNILYIFNNYEIVCAMLINFKTFFPSVIVLW